MNSANVIRELRDRGFKVSVGHWRRTDLGFEHQIDAREALPAGGQLFATGGKTLVDVFDGEGNLLTSGVAVCSDRDNYCKRIGRDIALGRALKQNNLLS